MNIQLWAAWAVLLVVGILSTYVQLFVKQFWQPARWFGVAFFLTYLMSEFFLAIYCGNHLANFIALVLVWFVLFYVWPFIYFKFVDKSLKIEKKLLVIYCIASLLSLLAYGYIQYLRISQLSCIRVN